MEWEAVTRGGPGVGVKSDNSWKVPRHLREHGIGAVVLTGKF